MSFTASTLPSSLSSSCSPGIFCLSSDVIDRLSYVPFWFVVIIFRFCFVLFVWGCVGVCVCVLFLFFEGLLYSFVLFCFVLFCFCFVFFWKACAYKYAQINNSYIASALFWVPEAFKTWCQSRLWIQDPIVCVQDSSRGWVTSTFCSIWQLCDFVGFQKITQEWSPRLNGERKNKVFHSTYSHKSSLVSIRSSVTFPWFGSQQSGQDHCHWSDEICLWY